MHNKVNTTDKGPPATIRPPLAAVQPNNAIHTPTTTKYRVDDSDIFAPPSSLRPRTSSVMQTTRAGVLRRQSSGIYDGAYGQQPILDIGDTVEVPGGMTGTVRYIGGVKGKNGTFAGVELNEEWATRGKNDGDVDGIHYFSTSIPGSGIFLPTSRAIKVESETTATAKQFPAPPITPVARKISNHVDTPTPGLRSFSQSLGPGVRHPLAQSMGPGPRPLSPPTKLKSRPSLPRPASPIRKTPVPQQIPATSGASDNGTFRAPPSPAPPRNVKPSTPLPTRAQSRAQSRLGDRAADEGTPTGVIRPSHGGRVLSNNTAKSDETRRLQKQLEERERQLAEQSDQLRAQSETLADLEASLSSLQHSNTAAMNNNNKLHPRRSNLNLPSADHTEINNLRAQLHEKTEKIASLTAEFDAHRHDFRDTIDALEAASAETERVYQKQVQDLQHEVDGLQGHREEIEAVTEQFSMLEAMVQELEEGLDDARRSEAEARLKVEELEGKLERALSESRQERERSGFGTSVNDSNMNNVKTGRDSTSQSKVLEKKDDEIRGLKAIIHGLSSQDRQEQQSHSSSSMATELDDLRSKTAALTATLIAQQSRESDLLTELSNLRHRHQEQQHPHTPSSPPPPLPPNNASPTAASPTQIKRNSGTFSSTTAVRPFPRDHDSLASFLQASPRFNRIRAGNGGGDAAANVVVGQSRRKSDTASTLSTGSEKDGGGAGGAGAAAAADLVPWCEICEVEGHDVLSCDGVGGGTGSPGARRRGLGGREEGDEEDDAEDAEDANGDADAPESPQHAYTATPSTWFPSRKLFQTPPAAAPTQHNPPIHASLNPRQPHPQPQPLQPSQQGPQNQDQVGEEDEEQNQQPPSAPAAIPGETGPAPGKRSLRVDMEKWCAFCERDGHDSVDCPFEEEL